MTPVPDLLVARGTWVVGQLDVLESVRRRLLRSATTSATLLHRRLGAGVDPEEGRSW